MDIFIDESGLFSNPMNKDNYVCCLAGLIIPELKKEKIFNEYIYLISQWKTNNQELKGSQLSEAQSAEIIKCLSNNRVILCLNAIDMGLHEDSMLTNWKEKQADKFIAKLTPEHHPNIVKAMHELRGRFLSLPNQLFVQAIMLIELVDLIIKTSTLYYCQRTAHTLKRFNWTIDAKDILISEYEKIWGEIVCTILQTKSFNEPLNCLIGGNYKYFERFRYKNSRPPEYLTHLVKKGEDFSATNIGKIMKENLSFNDSKSEIGLQIVDNLVTIIRRAFNGNLGIAGWEYFGKLMIYDKRGTIKFVSFNPNLTEYKAPYYKLVKQIEKFARPILK